MTGVKLKYLHCFRDRHGKPRCFFRYRGQRWPLPLPGTEGFATGYDALLAHIKANPLLMGSNVEFMPGSLAWAIEKFLASPLYNETTKRNYRRILDQLRESWGGGLLRDLQPRHVRKIRIDIAAKSTTGADLAMSLISALWEFAIEHLGLELDADPTHGVKRVHKVRDEHEPWPPELIDRFMREARPGLRWAVKLALYTGQRRSDLVKMKWSQYWRDDKGRYWIDVRQQTTGEPLSIPCHKALRTELENMPRVAETVLRRRWRIIPSGVTSAFSPVRRWISGSKVANPRTQPESLPKYDVDIAKNLPSQKKSGLALRLSACRRR